METLSSNQIKWLRENVPAFKDAHDNVRKAIDHRLKVYRGLNMATNEGTIATIEPSTIQAPETLS